MGNEYIDVLNFEPMTSKSFPPGKLKSSWSINDRQPPPPRKDEYFFMLDALHDGLSLCRCNDVYTAFAALEMYRKRGVRAQIRPVKITEESRQDEERERRKIRQLGR